MWIHLTNSTTHNVSLNSNEFNVLPTCKITNLALQQYNRKVKQYVQAPKYYFKYVTMILVYYYIASLRKFQHHVILNYEVVTQR